MEARHWLRQRTEYIDTSSGECQCDVLLCSDDEKQECCICTEYSILTLLTKSRGKNEDILQNDDQC